MITQVERDESSSKFVNRAYVSHSAPLLLVSFICHHNVNCLLIFCENITQLQQIKRRGHKKDEKHFTSRPDSSRTIYECSQRIESVGGMWFSDRTSVCDFFDRVSARHPVPQTQLENRPFPYCPSTLQSNYDETYDDFCYGQD